MKLMRNKSANPVKKTEDVKDKDVKVKGDDSFDLIQESYLKFFKASVQKERARAECLNYLSSLRESMADTDSDDAILDFALKVIELVNE